MTTTDTTTFIESIKQQLANAPEGVDTSALVAALEVLANPEEERVKIWFLLDRSGHHAQGQACFARSARASDTMQVALRVGRQLADDHRGQ